MVNEEEQKSKVMDTYESSQYIGKTVDVQIERPMGSKHPDHGFEYPVNYGFLPNTMTGDDEELDTYVLGVDKPIKNFTGLVIATIHRLVEDTDDKLVVTDGRSLTDEEIMKLTNFQEQYFNSVIMRVPLKKESKSGPPVKPAACTSPVRAVQAEP